ncbi:MAG: hypothetical protein RRY29_03250 [Desulfovibrionaceae bacterium]
MLASRKVTYGMSALVLACVIADLCAYMITGQEEVLWCLLGFFALVACGVVMWLKVR